MDKEYRAALRILYDDCSGQEGCWQEIYGDGIIMKCKVGLCRDGDIERVEKCGLREWQKQ